MCEKASLCPDGVTTWPVADGRYGVMAVFGGAAGYARARPHRARLEREGVPQRLRRELDGAWTLHFGPLPATKVPAVLSALRS